MTRRVVVTGLGLVTPVGNDVESTWTALLAGTPGAAPITKFDPAQLSVRFACEVKGFDPLQYMDRRRRGGTTSSPSSPSPRRTRPSPRRGSTGSSRRPSAPASSSAAASAACRPTRTTARAYLTKGPDRVSPFFVPMFIPDIAAGLVSIRYGLKGPNFATVSACASSAHAIGESYNLIRHGHGRRHGHRRRRGGDHRPHRRRLLQHEGALQPGTTRPRRPAGRSTATATGSCWATAAPSWCWRAWSTRERARRHASWARCWATAPAATPTTSPRRAEHGEGAQRAMRACLADGSIDPTGRRLHQRPRHLHPAGRRRRDRGGQGGVRRAGAQARLRLHQVDDRPPARRGRRARVRRVAAGDDLRHHPAHHQPVQRPIRSATSTAPPTARSSGQVDVALSNSFGFGGHNVTLAVSALPGLAAHRPAVVLAPRPLRCRLRHPLPP